VLLHQGLLPFLDDALNGPTGDAAPRGPRPGYSRPDFSAPRDDLPPSRPRFSSPDLTSPDVGVSDHTPD
jgi:hypothetical protein